MALKRHYLPPSHAIWQGRTDAPADAYFFQKMRLLNLEVPITPAKQLSFALIGFCCDEGIKRNQGRVGAKEGPKAIRQMLAGIALQRQDVECFDAGDIIINDNDLESAQHTLADALTLLLKANIVPIALGGGHELAWGHYQGIAACKKENVGIINIDAHLDMRELLKNHQGSSGTSFLQIAQAKADKQQPFNYYCIGVQPESNIAPLIKTAREHGTHILWIDDLQPQNLPATTHLIEEIITYNQFLYVSLCLDVFAAAYAPGVSAPQPFGANPWQIIPIVRMLAASKKVISYDIAELSPPFDRDNRTAKLAANFIYEIIHHHR